MIRYIYKVQCEVLIRRRLGKAAADLGLHFLHAHSKATLALKEFNLICFG